MWKLVVKYKLNCLIFIFGSEKLISYILITHCVDWHVLTRILAIRESLICTFTINRSKVHKVLVINSIIYSTLCTKHFIKLLVCLLKAKPLNYIVNIEWQTLLSKLFTVSIIQWKEIALIIIGNNYENRYDALKSQLNSLDFIPLNRKD